MNYATGIKKIIELLDLSGCPTQYRTAVRKRPSSNLCRVRGGEWEMVERPDTG